MPAMSDPADQIAEAVDNWATRSELIRDLEKVRQSRVLTYVTSDRPIMGGVIGQISDDACRPFYEQLRELGHVDRIDLFIYSRGGALDVPWRLVTALRQAAAEWNVLVPFRANSAATLIALGADNIVLGPQGELGPIDPILQIQRGAAGPELINVEDVMAYVRFVQERAGLSDQQSLTRGLELLANKIDAVVLGSIYRTHSHIRDLARRVLMSKPSQPTEQEMRSIVETLAERVYAHGHAVGFAEAKAISLPVEQATGTLDAAMWRLFVAYEDHMKLLVPVDPNTVTKSQDEYEEDWVTAMVETGTVSWYNHGNLNVKAVRAMPAGQLNVPLELKLELPGGAPAGDPAALQQFFTQCQALLQQMALKSVQEALMAQAPITNFQISLRGARWERTPQS